MTKPVDPKQKVPGEAPSHPVELEKEGHGEPGRTLSPKGPDTFLAEGLPRAPDKGSSTRVGSALFPPNSTEGSPALGTKENPILITIDPAIAAKISARESLTENEIGKIVQAIVAQDGEYYPGGSVEPMLVSKKYFQDRRYRIGEWEFCLETLAGRVRKVRGLKVDDTKLLSKGVIIEEWKKKLFGIEKVVVERDIFEISLNFAPSKNLTEEEIDKIVQAIVAQDGEYYPKGNVTQMSTSAKYLVDRRYRVGKWEFCLQTLLGRVRQARGLKIDDIKLLGNAVIVERWKRELFGVERVSNGFPITLDFEPSENLTEEQIGKIVKAIVAQDGEYYPGGSVEPMSTGLKYFIDRRYRVGKWEFSLCTLAGRVRQARGLITIDSKSLSGATIIKEWKENLFGLKPGIMDDQAFQAWVAENGLGDILDLFGDDPALLIEALSFLNPKALEGRDVRDIIKAYVGLKVTREGGAKKPSDENSWEKLRRYILAMVQTLESGEELDLSATSFQRQRDLLVRLSRKAFEVNAQQLIDNLKTEAERFTPENYPALPPEGLSFLARLHQSAADHFEEIRQFQITAMRTKPYGYQREGAHFLTTHNRAILADEAGLGKSYQVIAAVQTLNLKRVLWITTAANKETLREEILLHSEATDDDIRVVISGDPRERALQIRALDGERYVITNYETLVALQKNDPDGYQRLTADVEAVIVDEAQVTDNPKTLRTKAIQDIQAERRWLLTATPYQNQPDSIWTLLNYLDPERYPDKRAFRQMYTESTSGLLLLHHKLSNLMLRRTKQETMGYFSSPSKLPSPLVGEGGTPILPGVPGEGEGKSYAEQLADGVPRVPRKVRIPPEIAGGYELSPEQTDLIAWMTADYREWAGHFNEHLPSDAEPIDLGSINALHKFEMIHRVIYEPEYFGITEENPLFKALDRVVAEHLARGKKIILWCWNTKVLDLLQERYARLGVTRIDGQVIGEARERARHQFQENPGTKLLLANYVSGGVGLTLTAAHAAIFVQSPPMYPLLYQAEGRHQRLIGLDTVRHAKDHVEVGYMIPRFPANFVAALEEPTLRETLSHGTLVEQTMRRLEGGELIYNLTMEGYGSLDDVDQYFKAGVLAGMGLTREEKLDYVSHLTGQAREYAETIRALLPLWQLVKGNAAAEESVLQLIEALRNNAPLAQRIGDVFRNAGRVESDDLTFILSLFDIRNKYIRQQILKYVPDLIAQVYAEGKTLADLARGLAIDRLSPVAFVAQIYLRSGAAGGAIVNIARELSALRDSPTRRYLEEHFLVGVFGILGNKMASQAARNLLANEEENFEGHTLIQRIHILYRLGLLARTHLDLLDTLTIENLEEAVQQALADFAGRDVSDVKAWLERDSNWQNRADHLLALLAAYQEHEDPVLLGQYAEVLGHIIDGDLREWRLGPNNREHGNGIDYLSDNPKFWETFAQDSRTETPEVTIQPAKVHATLVKDYIAILQEWDQAGEAIEGKWVDSQIKRFREVKRDDERSMILEGLKRDLRELGIQKSNEETLEAKATLQFKMNEIRNAVVWMELDEGFRALNKDQAPDWARLIRHLENKVRLCRMRGYDKVAEHLETLRDALQARKEGAASFTKVTIEDSDDPALISRMGTLHPEMTNCFNPNGNPTFSQFVVGALGSKNMKMVVVKAQTKPDGPQEIVAAAMVKVKQLEDGSPVLFLERGIYRKGYDFRNEMLQHLATKADKMTPAVVMDEVRGKPKETDPLVYGTGAYTDNEYVESVFGLRRSENVKHRGRVASAPSTRLRVSELQGHGEPGRTMARFEPYSIGTSNKTIETYIAELQGAGVTDVVDVRGAPFSRFRPHFNRDRMSTSLGALGIKYHWLGDTLGNPQDTHGERTLEGFEHVHMKTPAYETGIGRLMEIMHHASGRVAVTCAEGAEKDCHRKFILEDIRQRRSRGTSHGHPTVHQGLEHPFRRTTHHGPLFHRGSESALTGSAIMFADIAIINEGMGGVLAMMGR